MIADLPPISTALPREKPVRLLSLPCSGQARADLENVCQLPKPAAMTKWQAFAKAKGIAPKAKKDKMVYDEEKQEWVPRWGFKGKNRDAEGQWLHEVKPTAGAFARLASSRFARPGLCETDC